MRHNTLLNVKHGDTMIKQVTIKLGATTPTAKQYESARADIETTYSLPDEIAMDLEKSMDMHTDEMRRAKIMLSQAVRAVKAELEGKSPEPKKKALSEAEKDKLRKLLGD